MPVRIVLAVSADGQSTAEASRPNTIWDGLFALAIVFDLHEKEFGELR